MKRISENVIIIEQLWVILVPLLLALVGISCLLVGVAKRDRVSLLVSGSCFLALFALFSIYSFMVSS